MALREEQILRYSRQILLREVGGRGQESLLQGGVRLEATSTAGLSAAAWLAAGGSGVEPAALPLAPGAVGFLVAASEVGRPASEILARALPALNPDSVEPRSRGQLAELPATVWQGEGPWVALGSEGPAGVVAFRGERGCPGCFLATLAPLGPPPQGALGVGLGALGALVLQRLLLGLGQPLGACAWVAPGVLQEREVRRCGRCG